MSATEKAKEQAERALARAAFVDSLKAAGLDMAEPVPAGVRGYTLGNWVRGDRTLIYEQFGSYQGEWLSLTLNEKAGEYRIYKGWYGSCSGCDAWEGGSLDDALRGKYNSETGEYDTTEIGRGDERVLDWAFDYPPFIEIPRATAAAIAENGAARFVEVMPANLRGDYSEIDMTSFSADAVAEIKLEENLVIKIGDIFATPNAELRRRLMERYGVDRVVADGGFTTLDTDGPDSLVRAPETLALRGNVPVYLFLKDSSTPRRYLLRVPPEMERVRQAKAWTFGVGEKEYAPLVET